MTFRQIRYFLVLAEELHFWRAAEKLYISQSSLSRHIQQVEEDTNLVLFERDKRNVKLTEAGIFLRDHWRQLLDDYQRGLTQAKNIAEGSSGRISITYPGSIAFRFLPVFLKEVNKNLPELTIELIEPPDENHIRLLLDFQIDLAFSRDRFIHQQIATEKLSEEAICLVVPQSHRLNEMTFENFSQLANESFITSRLHDTTYFASVLREFFIRYEFQPKVVIESDFGAMILSLVSQGLGVSILPESFKSAGIPGVRFIDLEETVPLFVNFRKNDPNKTVSQVLNLIRNL